MTRSQQSGAASSFFRFFFGSLGGLCVDVGGFFILTSIGLEPGLANLLSSFVSITVVYALVTRYAFEERARPATYVMFVAWYSGSVVVFSAVIEIAARFGGGPPLLYKAAVIPISFLLNYGFSRWLFDSRRKTPLPANGSSPSAAQ